MKMKLYVAALSVLLLVACNDGKEEVTEPIEKIEAKAEAEVEKPKKAPKVSVLSPSVEEYETKFRDGLSMAFSPSSTEKLENGNYSIALQSDIFLFIEVNKNDEVVKSSIAATTDSFDTNKDKIKYAFITLVKSADSDLNDTQIAKLFDDLEITWDNNMLDQTEVKTFNQIKYIFKGDNETGSLVLQTAIK